MKRLIPAPLRVLTCLGLVLLAAAATLAGDDAALERMKKDIVYLASDECEGRGIDTQGINKAADYIVNQLRQAGLKPGGKDGGWFQPFAVNQGDGEVKGVNTLTLRGPEGKTIELTAGKDFKVLPVSASGSVAAPLVFVGYGLSAPSIHYDDFHGINVAGKIVVVLRRLPRWDDPKSPLAAEQAVLAGFERKIGNSELNRAAAVVFVNDRSLVAEGDEFMDGRAGLAGGIPVLQLRRGLLEMMMASGKGPALADLEKEIDKDLQARSGPIPGWSAALTTTLARTNYACKNILATLEGSGPLANETVIVGAHYDHLGFGGPGSLAPDKSKKQIHHGADDNASGTTTVIEVARHFAAVKDRKGRRLVFILFSGEERGLLGSKYYCNKEPLWPLPSTVAMVNLDMVGRAKEKEPQLSVGGVGTGKGLEPLMEKLTAEFGFELKASKSGYGPSDHDSFYRKKVPVLFFFTGYHSDYHRPSDTADRINIPGMVKVAALTEKLVAQLSTQLERPEYVHMAPPTDKGGGAFSGAKMRLIPDYNDEGKGGMLVESVVEGGPAAKGGILPGDRIISIKGEPTPSVNAYMAIMSRQKSGVALEVTVQRKGIEITLKVTPD